MNKFLSSFSSGISEDRVREIIEDTSVIYNDDSSVSINNSANASIYTLPTVGGVPGNSVVVGADGKHLIFANTGGGGGVQNPMSVDLDAGSFNINNIESLTSNYIDTDNITPKTGSSILVNGDLNLNSNGLTRVDKITCLTTATPSVDLKLDLIPSSQGTANQVLSRSPLFDPANSSTYKLVWQTIAGGGGGVQNPMSVDLDAGGFSINNIESLTSNYIDTDNITPKTGSSILVNGDLNLNSNGLTRVDRITCFSTATPSVDLKLDLVPLSQGTANQVLARSPLFDAGNSSTWKLVWQTPAGGGITNPLTANIQSAQYSMFDMNTLECKNVNIMTSGGGLSSMNGALQVPITWGLALKLSADPFYRTFNTDYITPATGAGVTIDSKLQDGKTDSRITLSSPSIVINNSTNPTPSAIEIKGNIQITNNSGYIQGDTLFLRGRTSGNVPTPLTLESLTTNITSNTLTITTTTNNFDTPTSNFYGTIKTNTIDTFSGGNISCLQNLTLAVGKQLKSTLMFSDGLRANTTNLIIAGLLPDNKTQSNVYVSAPIISLDNQFDTITGETQVNLTGSLIFNNTGSTPIIQGPTLTIRGRSSAGSATPIVLESTILNIVSSSSVNVAAPSINFDRNINLFANRGAGISPSMVLYRTIGLPSIAYDIRNGATYVNVTTGQTGRGSKTIPANGLSTLDLYKFNLIGVMSCDAKIDMTFSIYAGSDRICTFTCSGDALTNQGFEFTTTLNVRTVSLGVVSLSTGIGKFEKDGKSISYAVPINVTNLIVANSNTFDIYMKPVSTMTTGSVSIYNFSIENI